MMNMGTVYWITGYPGAGKTTISELFYQRLKLKNSATVILDGDDLRQVYGESTGYSVSERKAIALRNARLCRYLAAQGIDVICATVSLFKECHEWNRQHIPHYCEVYLKVPHEVLIQRDQKGLYSTALSGEMDNVIGINLVVDEPENPDILLINDGKKSPGEIVTELEMKLNQPSFLSKSEKKI